MTHDLTKHKSIKQLRKMAKRRAALTAFGTAIAGPQFVHPNDDPKTAQMMFVGWW